MEARFQRLRLESQDRPGGRRRHSSQVPQHDRRPVSDRQVQNGETEPTPKLRLIRAHIWPCRSVHRLAHSEANPHLRAVDVAVLTPLGRPADARQPGRSSKERYHGARKWCKTLGWRC